MMTKYFVSAVAFAVVALYLQRDVFAQREKPEEFFRVDTASEDYLRGQGLAKNDIENSKLQLLYFGMPEIITETKEDSGQRRRTEREIYEFLLEQRYGLSFSTMGCMIYPKLNNFVEGYNSVVIAFLERKYGKGILDLTKQEAATIFKNQEKKKKDG